MSLAMLLPPRDTVQTSLYGEQNTCSKAQLQAEWLHNM